jgi:hypothetical protein
MKKTKLITSIAFLSILIFTTPQNGQAQEFFIKFGVNIHSGGSVQDEILTLNEMFDHTIQGPLDDRRGLGFFCEFIFQPHRNFGISLGSGYLSVPLNGKTVIFSPVDEESNSPDYTLFTGVNSYYIPVSFSLIYSLPLIRVIKINIFGGGDYYFNTPKGASVFQAEFPSYGSFQLNVLNSNGNVNGWGYHFGGGFDVTLPSGIILSAEAQYMSVSFDKITCSGKYGGDSSFSYFFLMARDFFDYQVTKLNLSGMDIRVGFKIKL